MCLSTEYHTVTSFIPGVCHFFSCLFWCSNLSYDLGFLSSAPSHRLPPAVLPLAALARSPPRIPWDFSALTVPLGLLLPSSSADRNQLWSHEPQRSITLLPMALTALALVPQSPYQASTALRGFGQLAEAEVELLTLCSRAYPVQLNPSYPEPCRDLGALANCGCLSLQQQSQRQKLKCCRITCEGSTREEVGKRSETKKEGDYNVKDAVLIRPLFASKYSCLSDLRLSDLIFRENQWWVLHFMVILPQGEGTGFYSLDCLSSWSKESTSSLHKLRCGQLTISHLASNLHLSSNREVVDAGQRDVMCSSVTWGAVALISVVISGSTAVGGAQGVLGPFSIKKVHRSRWWLNWIWSHRSILMSVQLGSWAYLCCKETSCPFKETLSFPFQFLALHMSLRCISYVYGVQLSVLSDWREGPDNATIVRYFSQQEEEELSLE